MAAFNKPAGINKVWAATGDVLAPSDTKISQGWQVEIPPRQTFNWIDNRQDQAIAHINQFGISVWDSATEYQAGKSYVQGSDGKIYVAIQTNTNQNPVTDTAEIYWVNYFKQGNVLFSTAGNGSWTVPPVLKLGVKKATAIVIGGGGGGGGSTSSANYNAAGGGGAGGGCAIKLVDLTGTTTVSYTIGAAGIAAATGGTVATTGGTTSFGAFCSATGGAGGNSATGASTSSSVGAGNDGGIGSSGDVNLRGGAGIPGVSSIPSVTGTSVAGGGGGGSYLSGGSRDSAAVLGAGGGGGFTITGSSSVAGKNGAPGCIYIFW